MSSSSFPPGVFAVQCPKCRKFMLVEEHDRGKSVQCLLCPAQIKVGGAPAAPAAPKPR